jgi:hypothetical protein
MQVELDRLVRDLAACIKRVDARRPIASTARTGVSYQPGIGPHAETAAAFEVLARVPVTLGERCEASFTDLIHPVHQRLDRESRSSVRKGSGHSPLAVNAAARSLLTSPDDHEASGVLHYQASQPPSTASTVPVT